MKEKVNSDLCVPGLLVALELGRGVWRGGGRDGGRGQGGRAQGAQRATTRLPSARTEKRISF